MIEGLPLSEMSPIISQLGLTGLVLILWYVDQRRIDRERQDHRDNLAAAETRHLEEISIIKVQFGTAMGEAEKRFEAVVRMYEDNVLLVKGYEKLAGDLTNIIHLNTQVNTRLVEKIENNAYCPAIRARGIPA